MRKILLASTVLISSILVLTFSGFAGNDHGALGSTSKETYDPTWSADAKGQIKKMDFTVPLVGISDPGMMFTHFNQRNLLIFYFSPMCSHCIRTYPKINAISEKFSSQGLTSIAVAVSNVNRNEIRRFVNQQNVSMPVFQDIERKFSANYGSGHIPLIILVGADGKFIRYTENGPHMLDALEKDLKEMYGL